MKKIEDMHTITNTTKIDTVERNIGHTKQEIT